MRLGVLRQTRPLSDAWGYDRGTPIDRHYIERFLAEHSADIRGHVLEVKDSAYTKRFGRGVEQVDVLDVDVGNPLATIVADLSAADAIPSDTFDCVVLTQTLQFIPDVESAIRNVHRVLRPSGVLLATVPCVSRLARQVDYWRFTPAGCAHLVAPFFEPESVTVRSYGNVLGAIAFLTGLACEELSTADLDRDDHDFPVVVAVRAQKRAFE